VVPRRVRIHCRHASWRLTASRTVAPGGARAGCGRGNGGAGKNGIVGQARWGRRSVDFHGHWSGRLQAVVCGGGRSRRGSQRGEELARAGRRRLLLISRATSHQISLMGTNRTRVGRGRRPVAGTRARAVVAGGGRRTSRALYARVEGDQRSTENDSLRERWRWCGGSERTKLAGAGGPAAGNSGAAGIDGCGRCTGDTPGAFARAVPGAAGGCKGPAGAGGGRGQSSFKVVLVTKPGGWSAAVGGPGDGVHFVVPLSGLWSGIISTRRG